MWKKIRFLSHGIPKSARYHVQNELLHCSDFLKSLHHSFVVSIFLFYSQFHKLNLNPNFFALYYCFVIGFSWELKVPFTSPFSGMQMAFYCRFLDRSIYYLKKVGFSERQRQIKSRTPV